MKNESFIQYESPECQTVELFRDNDICLDGSGSIEDYNENDFVWED